MALYPDDVVRVPAEKKACQLCVVEHRDLEIGARELVDGPLLTIEDKAAARAVGDDQAGAKGAMLSNFLRAQATVKLRFGRIMHCLNPMPQQCRRSG